MSIGHGADNVNRHMSGAHLLVLTVAIGMVAAIATTYLPFVADDFDTVNVSLPALV
jgi:hypothetical protein